MARLPQEELTAILKKKTVVVLRDMLIARGHKGRGRKDALVAAMIVIIGAAATTHHASGRR